MKQVHIIGGTGRIGQLLVEILKKEKIDLSLYVRSKEKARTLGFGNITLTEGNVLDTDALSEAIKGKDYVVAILSGDLLSYAKSIAIALKNSPQTHIIWVTGMGIHHEVPGEVGKLLDELCRQMPEGEALHANSVDRIAVARLIADLINGSVPMETSIGVTN